MAEEVGAIVYTVEADTSDLLTAEKQIDKATNEIVKDFEKIDTATKKNSNEIKKTTKAVDAALSAQTKATERAAKSAERAAERKAKSTERAAERSARAAEKASERESAAARKAAEISAREAKKAADAKISAANKAAAATAAANKRVAISEQKRVAGIGRSSGQAGIQIQQFIGQIQGGQSAMLALSQQSADLGFVLGAPLLGAVMGISASLVGMFLPSLFKATDGILSLDDSIEKLTSKFDKLSESQKNVAKAVIIEKIKEQKKAVAALAKEVNVAQTAMMTAQRNANGRLLERVFGSNPEEAQADFIKLKGSLTAASLALKESEKQYKELGTNGDKFKDSLDNISNGIKSQVIALVAGEEASFRFAAAQQLGLKIGEQIPPQLDAEIKSLFQLKKALDDVEKTKLNAAKDKQEKKTATTFASGVINKGLSPIQKLEEENAKLLELKAKYVEDSLLYDQALTTNEQQQADLRTAIKDKEASAAVKGQQMMTGAVLGFVAASTGAIMQGMDEQSGAYKVMFAIQKASAIASTIISAHTASAAMLSPTTGLGPVAGAGPSAAILAMGYASAGIIAGTAIAGARQFGGQVNAGSAYRVGEAGPEIYSAGGKNYMIPGENGKVIANDDLGGGGFTQTVEIINNTPANVSTNTSDDGKQMRIVINEIANQINTNQGAIPRALRAGTNTRFKANS